MKFLLFLMLGVFYSCGSVEVSPMNGHQLSPLPEGTPVTVFATKEPSFRYEKICDIDIESKGMFTSTTMEGYSDQVETKARECGAEYAIISSLSGIKSGGGANVTVHAYGIRKLSNPDTLKKEDVKKIFTAAQVDNVSALKKLLKDIPKKHEDRSEFDQRVLSFTLVEAVHRNGQCSTKAINYLLNDLDAKLIEGKEKIYDTKLENVFGCRGVIKNSFTYFEDRAKLFKAFNNFSVGFINNGKKDNTKKQIIVGLLPKFKAEASAACEKNADSEICILKPRIEEIGKKL